MKTYLLDTFSRFKRYSEKLDAQTVLCNKCWLVFNDAGEKETYIFKEDGSIIISLSGAVTYGKWEYIPVNKSVIISGNSQSFMVIPSFLDECILALQVDGTNNFAFLIDEQNKSSFAPKTYQDVVGYFETKERKVIEAEKEAERIAIEIEKEAQRVAVLTEAKRIEAKKRALQAAKEAERKFLEEILKKEEDKNKDKASKLLLVFLVCFIFISGFTIMCLLVLVNKCLFSYLSNDYNFLIDKDLLNAVIVFIFAFLVLFLYSRAKKIYIRNYIINHPDDPVIPYLEKEL